MSSQPDKTIEALLLEKRQFPPRKSFQEQANVRDPSIYRKADRDFEKFWAGFARELTWYKPWKRVLEWKPPKAKWFLGGKLNASVNCIDRHVLGHGERIGRRQERHRPGPARGHPRHGDMVERVRPFQARHGMSANRAGSFPHWIAAR